MPEQNFTEIGRLHVQIQFDEKELESLKREGNEITHLLRVIADCLDSEQEAGFFGFIRDSNSSFVSDHENPGKMITVEGFKRPAPKKPYPIPSDADVKRVMGRIHALENQISGNKKQIEQATERERNRPD